MTKPFLKHTRIFLDGADKKSIETYAPNPLIQGFTTNPSLMKAAGVTDYRGYCKELIALVQGKSISFEIFADDEKEMLRQGKEIATWGKNVFVKIPVMNTKEESTVKLIKEFTQSGVQLNVTAVFTVSQIIDVCQALKGGAPSYVSVFAGRSADAGNDPIPTMVAGVEICRAHGKQIELLWASTRETYNLYQADEIGCDIITVPPSVLAKFNQIGKTPYQLSVETVQTFKKDSDSAGFKM